MKPLRSLLVAGLAATAALVAMPLTASPAAAAVPGLQTVEQETVVDQAASKLAKATCPAGTVLLSGTAQINGPSAAYLLQQVVPLGDNAVQVVASRRLGGSTGAWSLAARATCSRPLPGLVTVQSRSEVDSAGTKFAQAPCPAGKQALGAGALISGAPTGTVGIAETAPLGEASIAAAAEVRENSTTSRWSVTTFTRCADPLPGLKTVFTAAPRQSGRNSQVVAQCPAGTKVLGGGVLASLQDTPKNPLGLFVDEVVPLGTSVNVVGSTGTSTGPWNVTAAAVCATV
jgi:hypothetical protein